MALVRNEFGIKGRVGHVVFCTLNGTGTSYLRSVSNRMDAGGEIAVSGGRAFLPAD